MGYLGDLSVLARKLSRAGIRYGLVGGAAMGAHGITRSTLDLDLLVEKEDLPGADRVFASLGWKRVYRSANVSHYRAARDGRVPLDVIHAFRPDSRRMLGMAVNRRMPDGAPVRVLRPEDIIGLKVQAMANDPGRKWIDTPDIEAIAGKGGRLDWPRILRYYRLFGREAEGKALRRRHRRP
jgi:hypothetical protein